MNNTEAWNFAIGLTRGAGLEPTEEFKECIKKEKIGKMTMEDLKLFLDEKYKRNDEISMQECVK